MQKRSEAARDTEVLQSQPRSREKTARSVVTYILALLVVVLLIICLSLAMRLRDAQSEGEKTVPEAAAVVNGETAHIL